MYEAETLKKAQEIKWEVSEMQMQDGSAELQSSTRKKEQEEQQKWRKHQRKSWKEG